MSGLPIPTTAPQAFPRAALILWLVVVGMAVFFLPLYLAVLTVREDAKSMETEMASIRVSLTNVPTPLPEIARQLTPLAQAQWQINQLSPIYPTLAAPRPDLPAVMMAINTYNPNEIALTTLTLSGNRITLNGRATRDQVVLAYVRMLEQTDLFDRVLLQSAQIVATITPTVTLTPTPTARWTQTLTPTVTASPTPSNTPTATPTGTATPTSTPSATPDLRDMYEPDDVIPHPSAIGEMQRHNFFPTGDIDQMSFPIKSQRYYQVLTSDLAVGVDTVVTVTLDGTVLGSNDDYAPGTGNFASAVCFRAPQDGTAVAKIINTTGFYTSDKTYNVKVTEVASLDAPPCPATTSMAKPAAHLVSSVREALTDSPVVLPARFQSAAAGMSQAHPPARLVPMLYRFVITLDLKEATP